MPEHNVKLVYSTDRAIQDKEDRADRNMSSRTVRAEGGTIVRLDRKGRNGKSVTIIEGLHLSLKDSEKLLKLLKAELGTGGTVKKGTLEIQGDHRDAVMTRLIQMGYKPKHSGG